jgi:ATP-dependent DNA helicase RecQ
MPVTSARPSKGALGKTVRDSVRLFQSGKDVATIAKARGIVPTTVETHLVQAMEAGVAIDIDRVLEPERRRRIEAVMQEHGSEVLGPVKEALGEDYSYGELRFVRAALRRAASQV